jgi:hypothetical protein
LEKYFHPLQSKLYGQKKGTLQYHCRQQIREAIDLPKDVGEGFEVRVATDPRSDRSTEGCRGGVNFEARISTYHIGDVGKGFEARISTYYIEPVGQLNFILHERYAITLIFKY